VLCTIGDLLLDVVVRLEGPIAEDTDTYGRTRVGPGGQAANVAAWTAALGGRARFLGKRARDPAGRMLAEELGRHGVEVAGPEVEWGTGTVVSIAGTDGTRTMLTDRGVAPELEPEEVGYELLHECEWLHIPGYSIVREPIRSTALAAADRVPSVSVDLSSTAAIEQAGVESFREALAYLAPKVVFGNELEVALVDPVEAELVVVKRGAEGILVRRAGHETAWPAERAEVVDTTGAGDALAAGCLLGGPALGLEAAARCVAQMGAFPPG
jgi:ribokinase